MPTFWLTRISARDLRESSSAWLCPTESGTEHKRHKREHKKHKKEPGPCFICAFCVVFCLLGSVPHLLGKAVRRVKKCQKGEPEGSLLPKLLAKNASSVRCFPAVQLAFFVVFSAKKAVTPSIH